MLSGMAIVAISYNDNEKKDHITYVRCSRFQSENGKYIGNLFSREIYKKIDIINMITSGTKVFTALENKNGWEIGAEVEIYPESEPKYIRTRGNSLENDNLGELPVFDSGLFESCGIIFD